MKNRYQEKRWPEGHDPWAACKRFVLRFALCYVAVYCVALFGVISFTLHLFSAPMWMQIPFPSLVWVPVVPWVKRHVLSLGSVKLSIWGSGDTAYDWVRALCEVILAFAVTGVWTFVARGRRRSLTLHLWLRVAVRTLLAAQMFFYGLDKVFPTQFREMTIWRMLLPMASKTPMGVLLW